MLVDRFLVALDDSDDPHWERGATSRASLPTELDQIRDRSRLRRRLLREPWVLDADATRWIIRAGIRFLCTPLSPLPTRAIGDAATGRNGDS